MKVRSLKFNSVVNLIKTILGIIFPLITFPYASRVLGATGIGKVDYANSISNYFILFASLGIATYTIREGAKVRDDKKKLDQLVTEIFVINSISTVVAYICLFICSSLPVFKNYQELILLNGTIMIFDLIGVNWLFNIFEDYIYITVRTLAFQIISLVLLFVFVQTPEDYLIYAGLIVFANAGANIFNIFYGRKYVSFFKCSKLNLKKHLKPIFIIFGIGIASQIYLNIDTTMLGLLKSDYDVGLYSAAIKINRTLGTLISSACAVLIPRLSYYIKMKMEKEYRNIVNTTVNYILSLSIPCAFGCALLSSECIFLFSGKGFEGAAPIMRILSPNIIFAVMNGFLAYQIFIPFGKELYTCIATFVGAILNVVLNSIFIITFGTRGAAVATVLAEISVFIILMYYMKKFYQDKTLFKEVWKYPVAGICMFIVGLGIAALGLGLILKILVTVVICIICYFGVLMILRAKIAFVVIDMLKARIKRK